MTSTTEIERRLREPYSIYGETTLTVVIAPQRAEEVIDRVKIGEPSFFEDVMDIGHSRKVKFLTFTSSKESKVKRDVLTVEETAANQRVHAEPDRRIEITSAGIVTLDAKVSRREASSLGDMSYMFQIAVSDVEAALLPMFAFVASLYDFLDPYLRHQQFLYGAAAVNLGSRSLVDNVTQQSGGSMARNLEGPLIIESGRVIGRETLRAPSDEIKRIVTLLRRALDDPS